MKHVKEFKQLIVVAKSKGHEQKILEIDDM